MALDAGYLREIKGQVDAIHDYADRVYTAAENGQWLSAGDLFDNIIESATAGMELTDEAAQKYESDEG